MRAFVGGTATGLLLVAGVFAFDGLWRMAAGFGLLGGSFFIAHLTYPRAEREGEQA